ncbi:response regulator [Vibrio sp. SCSIO 43136]|uniref:response regulator n=1 Tax=Vibrio sp. SCSIO 43136 TaxID=2819101 RepID=UPI0020764CD7|nr:response regulator [Vibrio sp. SCSIO 43136]USD67133.1 response regulator [Vibrio sp. SCSIO 43136]
MSYANLSVLIVDDSPMYRTAAKGMLQKLGFQTDSIHFAQDAKEAIGLCREVAFQLLLCDYNLGDKANGYQLLAYLQQQQLLPLDCTLVVVTGDGTPDVVRGFSELEPEGYLLKPLNYVTLQSRLPQLMQKKRQLSEISSAYSAHNYQQVVTLAENTTFKDASAKLQAQMIAAQAYMALDKLEQARNSLITMDIEHNPTVALMLAEIALKQRQYKQAHFLLDGIKTHNALKGRVAYLRARLFIASRDFASAWRFAKQASDFSLMAVERHWIKIALELGLKRYDHAALSLKSMVQSAKHSFYESTDMYLLGASLTLDNALLHQRDASSQILTGLSKWCEAWRSRFVRNEYKPFELLIFARACAIRGKVLEAEKYLTEYLSITPTERSQAPTQLEIIERLKVFLVMGKQELYQEHKAQLPAHDINTEREWLFEQIFSVWRSQFELLRQEQQTIKKRAQLHVQEQQYEQAVNLLQELFQSGVNDPDIANSLFITLSHAWPHGWSKRQVSQLIFQCQAQIHNTHYESSQAYLAASEKLAKQLNLKELKSVAVA